MIAALAIVAPALGGPSLKALVKKEVSKQIAKATGPAGPPGTNGTNGTNGADGTARAYALVERFCTAGSPQPCPVDRAKGVTSAARVATGKYCVTAPDIDPGSEVPAVSVERDFSAAPGGNATVEFNTDLDCSAAGGGFGVQTYRMPVTTVTDGTGTGTTNVAGSPVLQDDISFTIVIP